LEYTCNRTVGMGNEEKMENHGPRREVPKWGGQEVYRVRRRRTTKKLERSEKIRKKKNPRERVEKREEVRGD